MKEHININEHGHLVFGGVDTVELTEKYGTPLYVMDENIIRDNIRKYKQTLEAEYGNNCMICYASKAFSCKEIYRIVNDEGIGTDVVSAGELLTAVSVDFPCEKIVFHGNNKSEEELLLALNCDVGMVIVDNINELETLNYLAKKVNKKANISLRIKPGVEAHTHEFIRTGAIDSKFGFALETGEAFEAVKLTRTLENLVLKGFHCHIGSQIFDVEPFELTSEIMLEFMLKVKNETGIYANHLNLGGGFGIKYTDEDKNIDYADYTKAVAAKIKEKCGELGLLIPFISIEPGRSITGQAGITLYKIGVVKDIPGHRQYVLIDGGMTDNPRYIMYGAKYDMITANKANAPLTTKITLAGKCCESGDLIGENMPAPELESGDIIAVLATGAYNYSMASNYNRLQKPAVVMVKNGKSRTIINRESLNELLKNDV